jgi:hypothetical protein
MIIAGMTFIVGSIFLKETHNNRIWAEAEAAGTYPLAE